MKNIKKAFKIYIITFIIFTIITVFTYIQGLEHNTRASPYFTRSSHPKSLNELWQYKYEIFFRSLAMTIFTGSLFYYVNRNK